MNMASRADLDAESDIAVPAPVGQPALEVTNLYKSFRRSDGTVVDAVKDISLRVEPGEFVVLLGPSGCGKRTRLRSVAGLEAPESGRISIGGRAVYDSDRSLDIGPEKRSFSMVFQSYALWPHLSIFNNVAYPLQLQRPRLSKQEIRDRVGAVLRQVGIAELTDQYPSQTSGGQQQRVALARAIVKGDGLVLFDEPLSNVDAKVRDELRYELIQMQERLGFAALYVTHDQTEALQLADRIAVLGAGAVQHLGSPSEIYKKPSTPYVADFIGVTNTLHGQVISSDGIEVEVSTPIGTVTGSAPEAANLAVADQVFVMWRPERTVASSEAASVNSWRASFVRSSFLGSHVEDLYTVRDQSVLVWRSDDSAPEGQADWLTVAPSDVRVLKSN